MTFVPAKGWLASPQTHTRSSLCPGPLIGLQPGLDTGYTHSVINLIGPRAISLYEIVAATSVTTAL
jgi:hypothetical protein